MTLFKKVAVLASEQTTATRNHDLDGISGADVVARANIERGLREPICLRHFRPSEFLGKSSAHRSVSARSGMCTGITLRSGREERNLLTGLVSINVHFASQCGAYSTETVRLEDGRGSISSGSGRGYWLSEFSFGQWSRIART